MEENIAEMRAILIAILEKVSDRQSGEILPSCPPPFRSPSHTHANHGIPFALMGLLGSDLENQSSPSVLLIPAENCSSADGKHFSGL